jgi:hypothetical protein
MGAHAEFQVFIPLEQAEEFERLMLDFVRAFEESEYFSPEFQNLQISDLEENLFALREIVARCQEPAETVDNPTRYARFEIRYTHRGQATVVYIAFRPDSFYHYKILMDSFTGTIYGDGGYYNLHKLFLPDRRPVFFFVLNYLPIVYGRNIWDSFDYLGKPGYSHEIWAFEINIHHILFVGGRVVELFDREALDYVRTSFKMRFKNNKYLFATRQFFEISRRPIQDFGFFEEDILDFYKPETYFLYRYENHSPKKAAAQIDQYEREMMALLELPKKFKPQKS